MHVIERLTKQGKDLGYEVETVQTFVKEQQIELSNERKAIRKAERERREAEAKIEHDGREVEAKIEHEKREAERERREAEISKHEAEAKIEH